MWNDNKRLLIVDSYAGNIGDVGILISLVDKLRQSYPKSEIVIESSHPSILGNFDELKKEIILPRIFNIEKIDHQKVNIVKKTLHGITGIYDLFSVLLYALIKRINIDIQFIMREPKKRYLAALVKTDLIISTGGGFLNTNFMYFFRLYIYLIGYLLNKKIVLIAQSIGPFKSGVSRLLIPAFLHKTAVISVREPFSFGYLNKFFINNNLNLTADLAFMLSKKVDKKIIKLDKKIVAVSVKENKNKQKEKEFEIIMAKVCNDLISRKFQVMLICHTYKDHKICDHIVEDIRSKKNVIVIPFGLHPKKVKGLYSLCKFVIATRMHSIIFCSESKIPFISISSDNKFLGLHEQLSYKKRLLLNLDTLRQKNIDQAVDYLLANYSNLKNHLYNIIPDIKKLSQQNITLIKKQIK